MKSFFVNFKTFILMFKQLMEVLERKQKFQCIFLLIGVFICAMLETLGISAVIPFVLVLFSPDSMLENKYVKIIAEIFGANSYIHLLVVTAFLIVCVYIVKNAVLLFFLYYQGKFHNEIDKYLMNRQYRMFMLRPYSYYLKTNSSEVIRGINNDIQQVSQVIDGFTGFFSESITIVMIGSFIIIMDPLIAAGLIGTVMLVAILVVFFFKKRTSNLGNLCRNLFLERNKTVLESVNGYKDISIFQKKRYFMKYFEQISDEAAKMNTQYLFIMKIPGRVIETIFVASLLGMSCIKIAIGGDNSEFVTLISAMAVAAIRLLPSISSLSNYMNILIYNRPGMEATYQNVSQTRKEEKDYSIDNATSDELEEKDLESFNVISLENVSFNYENSERIILQDISLDIAKNESVAIIGESGSGKSTLLDLMLGLLSPTEGKVTIDDEPIKNIPYAWAKLVGYVPQNVFLTDDSVRRNIAFGIEDSQIDDKRIHDVIKEVQLESYIESLPDGINTTVGERGIRFSGGQRQRLAIARALYHEPKILVLDEATSALDNETEKEVMKAIDSFHGKLTIIIVAHRLTTIENCDKVYEVCNGKIVRKR